MQPDNMKSAIPFAMKRAAVDVGKHSVGEETVAKKQRKGNEKLPAQSAELALADLSGPALGFDKTDQTASATLAVKKQPLVKTHRNRMLKVQLSVRDPRNVIVIRNSTQSPLLSLPAEVRNEILELAVGYQHVHILMDPVPTLGSFPVSPITAEENSSITDPVPTPSGTRFLHRVDYKRVGQVEVKKFYNQVYPLDWHRFYSVQQYTTPQTWNMATWFFSGIHAYPDERIILASNARMNLVPSTCRQLYAETNMLLYTCNEFSFQDEGTARDWFFNRTPQQKRALKSVWFDMEFTSRGKLFLYSFNLFGKDSGITRVVVSRLAMRRAAELFTSQSGWCDDSMPILEKDAKDAIEKRLPNGVVIEFVD